MEDRREPLKQRGALAAESRSVVVVVVLSGIAIAMIVFFGRAGGVVAAVLGTLFVLVLLVFWNKTPSVLRYFILAVLMIVGMFAIFLGVVYAGCVAMAHMNK